MKRLPLDELKVVYPIKWTEDRLAHVVREVYRQAVRWDDAGAEQPLDYVAKAVLTATPFTYFLGSFSGIVSLYPARPGHDALFHQAIWDPQYLRRPSLIRGILKDAAKRWSFRRFSQTLASSNTLAIRNLVSLGFQHEGTLRQGIVYNSHIGDLHIYGLLSEEL